MLSIGYIDALACFGGSCTRAQGARAGPVVLVGGAAALGPQIVGAPSHICMQYTIYEGPNPDMC